MFRSTPVTPADLVKMQKTGVLSPCPVIDPTRLVKLNLSYVDFSGLVHHDGQMMVLDCVADHVMVIFKTLFDQKFPLHTIKLMDDFLGDDQASMAANNTSAFCDRLITGESDKPSLHAYGLAFDINPIQNPFITQDSVDPAQGKNHMDRSQIKPGYVEPIVSVCKQNGFNIWGGDWSNPKDYQHFQLSREHAERLGQKA